MSTRILFISDIVGQSGIDIVTTFLPTLIKSHKPDFVIANGENAHEGRGLNQEIVKTLYDTGIHVITGGNHSFDKWKIYEYMKTDDHLLRPMNYPKGAHGFGYGVYQIPKSEKKIGILNLQGRTFMQAIDCPFKTSDWVLEKIKSETNIIFVDFHAEATAEKSAYAWYVDGKVSAVVGTHTHTPTNDARILNNGTGFISDAGMTGSFNSVIGMSKDAAIKRFLLGTPHKFTVAEGDNRICAVIIDVGDDGLCDSIQPLLFPEFKSTR